MLVEMRTIYKSCNEIEVHELQEMLATERINHISSIIKLQYGIECDWVMNPSMDEYTIYLDDEDEGIYFKHTYSSLDLINCEVYGQAYCLKRDFCMCIALDAIKEYEEKNI